jgi:polar amino acid transport system substrate-binding protein
MKKFLFALSLFLVLGATAQITQLGLVSDVWPPFTNKPGESAVATEIVKTALNRNQVAVKERVLDFEMVIKGLSDGTFQASPSLWLSADREEYLTFSDPILYNQLVLVGRRGSDVSVSSLDELKGKKVGIVEGYAYGERLATHEGIELIKGNNDQANLLSLLKEEVDFILVDALLVAYLRSYQEEEANQYLEIGPAPLLTKSLHFAIRTDLEGSDELIATFNETIKKMQEDGTYHRILKLNWIQVDVDGDGTLEMIPGANAGREMKNAYSINGANADSSRIYYNGKYYNWEELPDDVRRTGINKDQVQDVTFLSFGL